MSESRGITVLGHVCLDLIPRFPAQAGALEELLRPGRLINMDAVLLSTGGAVPNVGIALHRLGVPVQLGGKVGCDAFGGVVRQLLNDAGPALGRHMLESAEVDTSYTVVLSPPETDRIFLHHPGANDAFYASDVPDTLLADCGLLHFGYPPLMKSIYENDGEQLLNIFQRANARGVATSLDMSMPDPSSPAGRLNWLRWFDCVLPSVDVFAPSLDEMMDMLGMDRPKQGDPPAVADIRKVTAAMLDQGVAVAALKLGEHGFYLQTSDDRGRFANLSQLVDADAWVGREMYLPCFEVTVAGTTGSGDCTVAGFLAGIVKGLTPQQAAMMAIGTGACSVEQPDASSGVQPWEQLENRIHAGWPRLVAHEGFKMWEAHEGVWLGPNDTTCKV